MLTSLFLFHRYILPLLLVISEFILDLSNGLVINGYSNADLDKLNGYLSPCLEWILLTFYYCFWIIPILILSLLINSVWYQDMSRLVMELRPGSIVAPSLQSQDLMKNFLRRTSNQIYGVCFIVSLILHLSIDEILRILLFHMKTHRLQWIFEFWHFFSSACIYSYYCFE